MFKLHIKMHWVQRELSLLVACITWAVLIAEHACMLLSETQTYNPMENVTFIYTTAHWVLGLPGKGISLRPESGVKGWLSPSS